MSNKRKPKQHPLKIEILGDWEYSGDIIVYYSKGHHPVDEFIDLINKEYLQTKQRFVDAVAGKEFVPEPPAHQIDPSQVKHRYGYSCLMDTEDGLYEKGSRTTIFLDDPTPKQGRFPCTVYEVEHG